MPSNIDIERNDAEIEDEKEEKLPLLFYCILAGLALLAICLGVGIYFIAFPSSSEVKNAPRCGKDWVPGLLQPKVQSGNFLIYGVKATIEDAKKECESQNAKLVTIDGFPKLFEVQNALMGNGSKHFYGINDTFWTGGYIEIPISGNKYEIKWHGSPNKIIPFSDKDEFVNFYTTSLEEAIANLKKSTNSIGKDRLGDCGSPDNIYLGIPHPDVYGKRFYAGLMMLNEVETFNRDTSKFFFVCEKNAG